MSSLYISISFAKLWIVDQCILTGIAIALLQRYSLVNSTSSRNSQVVFLTQLPQKSNIHRKKRLATFPSPAGMSLTKLSLGGNKLIKLFPPMSLTFFTVYTLLNLNVIHPRWGFPQNGIFRRFSLYIINLAGGIT